VNTGAPFPTASEAQGRVLGIQTKLHRWSTDDSTRRFDDLFNLVVDPAFLVKAWHRVRGNQGSPLGRGGRADSPHHRGWARR
jgi:RNA-directed DNA polymerase